MPPEEELLALLAVAETGSVTAAADRLHITQPALSRRLQRLGAVVGVPLLVPRGRGVVPTAAGLTLTALARRLLAEWQTALAGIGARAQPPLLLGCGATVALTLLPGALVRLRHDWPDLPLRVRSADSAATAARCLRGELDAGLVTTAADDPRLLGLPVALDPVVAVGPPGGAPRLTLRELAAGPLCLLSRGTGFRAFLDDLFAGAGLFPEPIAEMDGLEALRELVAAGLGRSLLPRSVASPALAEGRLIVLEVAGLPPAARTITLLRRADRPAHPAFAPLHRALLAAAGG